MSAPEISIIIPVFNAEKYLERCLDSVIESLDKTKGEIIAIDNNSTDNSLLILKKYAKKYPKIIEVLECKAWGAAAVRNYGAKNAKGTYLWFIDADDYIDKSAIPKLLKQAKEKKSDIVMMGALKIARNGERRYYSAVDESLANYKSRFIRYGMGPWQVIVCRKWWMERKFEFREGLIHEDMELMSSLILYTDNYSHIDDSLYYYCDNPNSVLHKEEFNPHIFDIFPVLEGLYDRFKTAGAEKKYHDELEWFFIWNLLLDSAEDFSKFPEGKPGFMRSRKLLKAYFPEWRKNRFLRQKSLGLKIRVRLNYYK